MATPSFFQRLVTSVLTLFSPPTGQISADHGRIAETNSLFNDPNPDYTWQQDGADAYARAAENDFVWAALDYRDISRLWISAAQIRDVNPLTGKEFIKHPGQLICPPTLKQEIGKFSEWQFDERLDRPLEFIIQDLQRSYMIYGFAVAELLWVNEETPHGLRSVLTDIQCIDTDRIIIRRVWADGTPVSSEQEAFYRMGDTTHLEISLKKYHTNNEDLIQFPPTKAALISNKGDFGNPYGQSELKTLTKKPGAIYSYTNISNFWDRHLERHGSPQMIHRYSADREGAQWDGWRKNQLAAIAKMQNQSVIQISEKGNLEALAATGETQSFLARLELLQRSISVALCGSATALIEGKTGARAKEESTTVRQKSAREQYDCSLIEAVFNYQIIPWLIDYNFGKQDQYPYIQIIPPEEITPTTPEGQQDPQMNQGGSKDMGDEEIVEPGANGEAIENEKEEPPEEDEDEQIKRMAAKLRTANFADANGIDVKKKSEELPEESKIGGFPERRTPNPLYKDKTVQAEARQVIGGLTVYTKREFDALSEEEKKQGFTFAGMPRDKDKIAELLQIYVDSLDIPNERKAFLWVRKQIREKDWGTFSDKELMPSFRYARDKGYTAGIIAKAKNQNDVYALQYITKDDPAVRWNHAEMHGVIQPVDSEFWEVWTPPNGFGCRCTVKIITQAQHIANPAKYTIRPYNKAIKPDKGW